MSVRTSICVVLSCLVGLVACNKSGRPTGEIRIDGSSTVYPVTEAVMEEFRGEHPEVRVTAGFSGTSAGFAKLLRKEIDVWDASREVTEGEQKQLAEAGIEIVQLTVAYDGLAVVIHPENDWAEELTVEQLKQIWQPENPAKKWSDINPEWPDEEIKLFGPGTASGTFEYFTEAIVGKKKSSRDDYHPSEDDNQLVAGIKESKYGLAYFGYAYYAENQDVLKLVAIDGGNGPVKPSMETVSGNTYVPLSRPLFIYVRKDLLAKPFGQDFVRFFLDNADELAQEVGYVAVPKEVAKENERRFESATSQSTPSGEDEKQESAAA